ncbi:hypothetical protein [Sinorhizobium fredii]|uniref:hypothetical protein n=1 Tax=Rhizobium fredii TaxID=380 RepID=UPI0004AF442C|nr:hypothetical protein [Sinorhizobium fredii]AWI60345.1 hypothetical protein AB395_00005168 [Sinorhizobium fredii CCBAU 45436]
MGIFDFFSNTQRKKKPGEPSDFEAVTTPDEQPNWLSQWLPEDPEKREALSRGLLMAGASMMAAGGPSRDPTNLLGVIGHGIAGGVKGYDGTLSGNQELATQRLQNQAAQIKLQGSQDFRKQMADWQQKWGDKGNTPEALNELMGIYAAAGDADGARAIQKELVDAETKKFGVSPIWGTDKDGNPVIGQLSDDGTFHTVDTGGFSPTSGTKQIDTGTEIITVDSKTGDVISRTPKDVAGEASQNAAGKVQGETAANLPKVEGAASEMLASIDSLSNDPYLDSMVGSIDARTPDWTSDAARVRSKMDQLGGQTFLQAFNSLRGAGAITEQEGAKAQDAIARLNRAQDEHDYREALNELRGVVQRGVDRYRQMAGVTTEGNSGSGDGDATTTAAPGTRSNPIRVTNVQELDALPEGTWVLGPDGVPRPKGKRRN